MKKMLKPLLILSALFFFAPHAAMAQQASNETYIEKVGDKLAHGIANTVTGIGEIPKNVMHTMDEKGAGYGLTAGLLTGIIYAVGRTLTGAVDLVTFIIPTKPIIYPDYIWQNWDRQTHWHPDWKLQ